jgi:hypothetical protein
VLELSDGRDLDLGPLYTSDCVFAFPGHPAIRSNSGIVPISLHGKRQQKKFQEQRAHEVLSGTEDTDKQFANSTSHKAGVRFC